MLRRELRGERGERRHVSVPKRGNIAAPQRLHTVNLRVHPFPRRTLRLEATTEPLDALSVTVTGSPGLAAADRSSRVV